MASTSVSADYHSVFQADKRSILSLFEISPPSLTDIAGRLQSLRSGLNDHLAFLPAYDRRNYDLQLKELEAKLSQLRAKDKPKSRFAFSAAKAKPSTATPIEAPPAPSSSASKVTEPIVSDTTAPRPTHHVSDKHHEIIRPPTDVQDGYTISLSSLSSCIVDLRPQVTNGVAQATSLHAKNLRRCILVVPVMEGSAIMEGLEECLVVLGAQQFRIHSSTKTTILLHVPSTPIIEHSSSLLFGPYPSFLESPTFSSKHDQVQDFDWIREGKSPNWSLVTEDTGEKGTFNQNDANDIGKLEMGDKDHLDMVLERLLGPSAVGLQPNAS